MTLEDFNNHVAPTHEAPVDIGARGTAQLGGVLSAAAGGMRFIRHGPIDGAVVGVEVVRADGTVVDLMSRMRKDNTGFHLKNLFVGAEGSLGIVTRVALACPPRPAHTVAAVVGAPSLDGVFQTLGSARETLGEALSAFELFDRASLSQVLARHPELRDPLAQEFPFYCYVEGASSHAPSVAARFDGLLEAVVENGLDGVAASSEQQTQALLRLREDIPEALRVAGHVSKFDVSLPLSAFQALGEECRALMDPLGAITCLYGHAGDGNAHLNVLTPADAPEGTAQRVSTALDQFVFPFVRRHGGSISAEHGIGQQKRHVIGFSKSPAAVDMMRDVKRSLDPKGLLNPYKVIPDA